MYMMRTPGKELPKGIRELHDGQVFETIGATVRCIATPGHTEDHASFLMEEEGALFTGDAVLGEGATTFEDLDKYLGSLRRMLDIPHARTIYPGHGPPVRDVRGRLNAYIGALATRETAILKRLKRERDDKGRKGISTIRLVYKLYGDKDMLTQLAGAQVVIAHLKKLYDMGVVDFKPQRFVIPDRWSLKGEPEGLFANDKAAQRLSTAGSGIGMNVADFKKAYDGEGDAKRDQQQQQQRSDTKALENASLATTPTDAVPVTGCESPAAGPPVTPLSTVAA